MRVRIRLDDKAHCLIGAPLRLDGRPAGRLTAAETEFDVDRGWHLLEVRDPAHPTRALRFQVSPSKDIETQVLPAQPLYMDYSWFELVPA